MDDETADAPPSTPDPIDFERDAVEQGDAIAYDESTGVYRASFDGTTESVALAVVSAIATVAGTEPEALTPLYTAVDPDALEAIVESTGVEPSPADVHVSFRHEGYDVTVHSYGIITVDPR